MQKLGQLFFAQDASSTLTGQFDASLPVTPLYKCSAKQYPS